MTDLDENDDPKYILDVFYVKFASPRGPTGFLLYGSAWENEHSYFPNFDDQFPVKASKTVTIPSTNESEGNDCIDIVRSMLRVRRGIFERFQTTLDEGIMDLTLLDSPDLEPLRAPMLARPGVLQLDRDSEWSRRVFTPAPESRSHIRFATVTTYWPLSTNQKNKEYDQCLALFTWLSSSAEGIRAIMSITTFMHEQTGLSFAGAYAQRVGCFEVYRFKYKLNDEQFSIEVESSAIRGIRVPTGLSVVRPLSLQHEHHFVQITLRNVHDITLSNVVQMPPGTSRSRIVQSPETFSEWSVTVYSSNGRSVVYHDHMHRMRGVGFDAMLVSQKARISDKFSSEQLASNRGLQNKLETVAFGLRSRHEVADFRTDPWYPRATALGALVSHARIGHNPDRFFPRGQDGQVDAILYVISLIEEPDNKRIIVADPFFDFHALSRVVSRVANLVAPLTIVTSLTSNRSDGETSTFLRDAVKRNHKVFPRTLQIISLARGDDQAFHDRYICLQKTEGRYVVYVLTNSLNKLAANWPLCITPLGHAVSLDVAYYLENLANGVDIYSRDAEIKREIVWPHTDGPHMDADIEVTKRGADRPEVRMEQALRWLLPGLGSFDELLSAAKECGLMCPGSDHDSQIHVNGPRLVSMFELSWLERPLIDVSALVEIFLGLGEMVAHIAGRGTTGEILALLRKPTSLLPATSDLLNASVEASATSTQDAMGADPAAVSVLDAIHRSNVDMETLLVMSDIIGTRSIRVHSWGLRWIAQIATALDPKGVSDWLTTTRLSETSAQDFLSGWEALCEYPLGPELIETLTARSSGALQVYLLCHAIGAYRIRPLLSFERLAGLLNGLAVAPALKASALLFSYKMRPFHDSVGDFVDDLSIESLASRWVTDGLSDQECDGLLKMDRSHGSPCIPTLAASLALGRFAVVGQGLDKAIVAQSRREWENHQSEHLFKDEVDRIETTLQSWLRIRTQTKPFDLLPNHRELAKSIAAVGHPFAEESGGTVWRVRMRSIICLTYVGVRLHSLLGDVPRADDFESFLLTQVVVPVLSLCPRVRNYINDSRVIPAIELFVFAAFAKARIKGNSISIMLDIVADSRFSVSLRDRLAELHSKID